MVLDPAQKMRNGRYGARTSLPDMYIGNTSNGVVPSYEITIKNGYLNITGEGSVSELIQTFTIDLESNYFKFDPEVLDQLCYQYRYDQYNRQIEQKTPGKGWEYMIYDHLDRPILVQDASLRKDHLWLFTKYDAFGRVTYSGKYSSIKSRSDLQNEVDTFINNSSNKSNAEHRSVGTSLIVGTAVNYTNNAFPTTGFTELLSVNYFDNYDFSDPDKPITPSSVEGQLVTDKIQGLPTANWTKTIGENSWSKSYNFYDQKGRSIKVYEKNYLGGYTSTESKLDFRGKVEKSTTKHQRMTTSNLLTIVDRYTYDKSERVKSQFQKINNQAEEHLFTRNYDEEGMLETKNVGGIGSGNSLQNIGYTYNIRGWLREINDVDQIGNDLFAYKLNYNDPIEGGDLVDAKPLFNGNISQTIWRSQHDNLKQSYVYNYDVISRLTDANYLSGDLLGRVSSYKFEVHNIKYDQNGNITYLNRKGISGAGNPADPNFRQLDYLTYDYGEKNGNQLMSITDTGNKMAGFIDGNTSGNDYEYDDNGNLIKDLNKKINLIEYNHLDLVEKITFSDNKSIRFIHDASGRKLSKIYMEGSNTIETQYLGSFQYQQGQLQFFPSPEGYVYNDNDIFKYTYIYSDHLGNNRLSYSDTNENGVIEVDEILSNSNYYPMGSTLEGEFSASVSSNFNYKFQGKELQLDNNIGLYDFGSRMYDPTVGRWFNTDPQNQFNSPYLAMGNNYIITIDPDGEFAFAAIGIGAVLGSFSAAMNGQIDNVGDFFLAAGIGAAAGGAGAGVSALKGGALLAGTASGLVGGAGSSGMASNWNIGKIGEGALIGGITGTAAGYLSQFGGGTFVSNVSWGITEGAAVGSLNSILRGNDIGEGALQGGILGGVFATGISAIESIKNSNDGYGFGTNDGRFNKLVKESVSGNIVNAVRAQRALDFWTLRNGGPNLNFVASGSSKTTTTGRIKISGVKFQDGVGHVRRTIAHEMGHYINNINWDNGEVGGTISNPRWINLDRTKFLGDGTFGYNSAIKNAGRYHVGYRAISNGISSPLVAPAWRQYGISKWWNLIPRRF